MAPGGEGSRSTSQRSGSAYQSAGSAMTASAQSVVLRSMWWSNRFTITRCSATSRIGTSPSLDHCAVSTYLLIVDWASPVVSNG